MKAKSASQNRFVTRREGVLRRIAKIGPFILAIDGTGLYSFGKRHCVHCIETKHESGAVAYSHKVLVAFIVSGHPSRCARLLMPMIIRLFLSTHYSAATYPAYGRFLNDWSWPDVLARGGLHW